MLRKIEGGSSALKNPSKEFASAKKEDPLLIVAATIKERRIKPDPSSYTSKLVRDAGKITSKINEECGELIEAGELLNRGKTRDNVIWEAADLIYFVLVYLENKGIEVTEVLDELKRRRTTEKKGQRYPPISD